MQIVSSTLDKKCFLDPRIKLLCVVMVSLYVLGGFGSNTTNVIAIIFSFLPFFLCLVEKRFRTFLKGLLVLALGYTCQYFFLPRTKGLVNFIFLFTGGILIRFVPSIVMAAYLVSTTTVSQFMCSMERMHVPNLFTIPLSVMFRFFPTVAEEASSINKAMAMRDIRFGGKKIFKIIEYRMIPLMTCSVRIGQELSAASLSRGLGGPVKRTNICKVGFGFFDYLMIAFCLISFSYTLLANLGVFS